MHAFAITLGLTDRGQAAFRIDQDRPVSPWLRSIAASRAPGAVVLLVFTMVAPACRTIRLISGNFSMPLPMTKLMSPVMAIIIGPSS